jgi:hypothetical protein
LIFIVVFWLNALIRNWLPKAYIFVGKGMAKKIPILSKSRFIAGNQCALRLWYLCFNRELASPVTVTQQARFDEGHRVGRLATRRYPGGVLISEDHFHHEKAVDSTLKAMADENVEAIFEG